LLVGKNTNKGCAALLVGKNTNKGCARLLVGENTNKGCAEYLVGEKHQQGLKCTMWFVRTKTTEYQRTPARGAGVTIIETHHGWGICVARLRRVEQ
jgi:hypothetical protein